MNEAYAGLAPAEVWRHFDALNKIGRPSGNEAAARAYVIATAEGAGYKHATDAYGNCVVYVPARNGNDAGRPAAVQAHLDMVRATAPGVTHDFDHDPIVPQRDGDRIFATGTTLGADNGIGAAMALALITDSNLKTGPLELLFTVEEETGLKGASALDGSLLKSQSLINLDSEDPSTLTIGCAGGETASIAIPVSAEPIPTGWLTQEIRVSGLQGGHSGVEIHKRRENAIKLIAALLHDARTRNISYELISITGGSAHNAIPCEASARVAIDPAHLPDVIALIAAAVVEQRNFWGADEPDLLIALTDTEPSTHVLADEDADKLIDLLDSIPTGVLKNSQVFPGKVQTSQNVATVTSDTITFKDGQGVGNVYVVVSIRSFVAADIDTQREHLAEWSTTVSGEFEVSSGYPSWEPNPGSKLLRITMEAFEHIMGKAPIVEVVHAGLECGVISAKVPGMEAISFGPTITGPHTPEESVYAESVQTIWQLLVEVLKRLA